MMRSPRSLAVVCRRPDGSVVIKEDEWRPVWGHLRFLRLPVLRGGIVLLESLVNGLRALTFAANQQVPKAASAPRSSGTPAVHDPALGSSLEVVGMVAVAMLFGVALFVGAPHLATWGLGSTLGFDATSPTFHIVDGLIKLAILVGYMAAISRLGDVQRLFQYHGAEHKAIFTFEQGLELTIANARGMSRFHPRCGTSFLLTVILVSVVLFTALLSIPLAQSATVDHLLKIAIKIPLMVPLAGLSYELIRTAGNHCETSRLARALSAPGMLLQKITTREPDDAQLEIALISIRKTLWREQQGDAGRCGLGDGSYEVFVSTDEINLPLVA